MRCHLHAGGAAHGPAGHPGVELGDVEADDAADLVDGEGVGLGPGHVAAPSLGTAGDRGDLLPGLDEGSHGQPGEQSPYRGGRAADRGAGWWRSVGTVRSLTLVRRADDAAVAHR